MKIRFSNHARVQLKERNLSADFIIDGIENPDKVIQQRPLRFRAQKMVVKNHKKYLLIVVYDEIDSTAEIVTAFLTTKFKKYL